MAYEPFPETFPELVGDRLGLRELCEAALSRCFSTRYAPAAGTPAAGTLVTIQAGLRGRSPGAEKSALLVD